MRLKSNTVRKRRNIEASRLYDVPWLLAPAALRELVLSHQAAVARSESELYDDEDQDDADYPIVDGVASIKISGVLTMSKYSGMMSYSDVGASISHALNNPSVAGILLCIHSPGGEVGDLFDLCDAIFSARSIKPIVALANDDCFSAAYALASSAEKVFVSRMAGTGSIGCFTAHSDYSGALQRAGVKIEYIYAGARKIDRNPAQPLSAPARATLQSEVDRIRALFVQTVARNRNVSKDALMKTEAACYMAADGIPLLADQLGTISDACAYLRSRIQALSPRSQRVIAPSKALPPTPAPHLAVAPEGGPIANLAGCQDVSLSRAESIQQFGKAGVVLAVRTFAQPQCRAASPAAG